MNILHLEPFYGSSHKQWVDGLISHSRHKIVLISMEARHWKWRMEHSAVHFATEVIKSSQEFDLILCNDLTNVAVFRGLLQSMGQSDSWFNNVPIYVYFHENQITYPWSEDDQDVKLNRDVHYGWINYLSCLAADRVIFNSLFHKHNFISSLPAFLGQFPYETFSDCVDQIKSKSDVLSIGLNLSDLQNLEKSKNEIPIILWNHRWEYDKNPELFFQTLFILAEEGIEFEVILAGQKYKRYPEIFNQAKEILKDRIIHIGYVKNKEDYYGLLQKSDVIPVTSNQDFFGISVIEAIAAGCYPLLPDRLAFGEHLQMGNKTDYYYGTDEYLLIKLRKLLLEKSFNSKPTRAHVLKYDWSNMIDKYDDLLEEAVRS